MNSQAQIRLNFCLWFLKFSQKTEKFCVHFSNLVEYSSGIILSSRQSQPCPSKAQEQVSPKVQVVPVSDWISTVQSRSCVRFQHLRRRIPVGFHRSVSVPQTQVVSHNHNDDFEVGITDKTAETPEASGLLQQGQNGDRVVVSFLAPGRQARSDRMLDPIRHRSMCPLLPTWHARFCRI